MHSLVCAGVNIDTRACVLPHPPPQLQDTTAHQCSGAGIPLRHKAPPLTQLVVLSSGFLAARWRYFRETQGRRASFLDVEFHEWAEAPRALGGEHFHQQVGES